MKTAHTGTGSSDTIRARRAVHYYADYDTGSGSGTAQLECLVDGDWLPADDAITASMTTVEVAEVTTDMVYRWTISGSVSGTIYTYLVSDRDVNP